MTSTISTLPDYDAPQVAINDIGSEEDFLAAIDATIKYFTTWTTRPACRR